MQKPSTSLYSKWSRGRRLTNNTAGKEEKKILAAVGEKKNRKKEGRPNRKGAAGEEGGHQ